MADKTTEQEAKIDKIVKDAIADRERETGKSLSSEARHAVREAVTESFKKSDAQTNLLGETIAIGTYALDGAAISNAVKAEDAVAATKNAFSPAALKTAYNEASGLTKGLAVLGRSAPALNVGFAVYDTVTAETTVERAGAAGGFISATLAAAGTGALLGSVIPGAGTLAVGFAGAVAGAIGYLGGKAAAETIFEKTGLSQIFESKASPAEETPRPMPKPVAQVAPAQPAPKLELIN